MKRKLRKSIKPIIGSILISMMLWFAVTTSKEFTTHIEIPLEISRLAKGKTLLQPVPPSVNLEIRGTGQSIIALYFYDATFKPELPQISKSQTINLSDYLVYLDIPSQLGLEVVEILDPKTINLQVDDFISSKKPVLFTGQINTEPGYIVMDTTYSQDSVQVSGPKSLISNVKNILTEKNVFQNQKYSFTKKINIESPSSEMVIINPDIIKVSFDIQRLVERVIYEIPVTVKNIPNNLFVDCNPPFLSLRVKGGEKDVEQLRSNEIVAEIDYKAQYNPELSEYPVSIKTPPEISWLESIPKTFKLTVKRK